MERAPTRLARREILRLPVFLWTTPLVTARMVSDSALRRASVATFASPEAIASSTVRHVDRIRVRRALFTAVRRPITRLAFFADFVFAMGIVFQVEISDAKRGAIAVRKAGVKP